MAKQKLESLTEPEVGAYGFIMRAAERSGDNSKWSPQKWADAYVCARWMLRPTMHNDERELLNAMLEQFGIKSWTLPTDPHQRNRFISKLIMRNKAEEYFEKHPDLARPRTEINWNRVVDKLLNMANTPGGADVLEATLKADAPGTTE